MTIEEGYLRGNKLKPSLWEWVIALCLFFGASILIYELIIYAFQSMLLIFTRFFNAHFKHTNERVEAYNWFIAGFSVFLGLNSAFSFLLRNRLNHPSFKSRFAARLAHHYAGLNQWGHFAWVTRLLYQIIFLALIFSLDIAFDPDMDYKWSLLLLLTEMYLSTWLMSHRYLSKDYFKYLRYSLFCLFFSFVLVRIQPIDFQLHNEIVAKKSVHSKGEFNIPVVNLPQPYLDYDYQALQLFAYKNDRETLPRLRVWLRGNGFRFMPIDSVSELMKKYRFNGVTLYAMKEATMGQLWRMESALKNDSLPVTIQYRAEASYDEWSHDQFEYYWNSEFRFLAPCELNAPETLEGTACRGLIKPDAPNVLHIQYSKGDGVIGFQIFTKNEVLNMIENHLKQYREKALILIEPDLDTAFGAYTQFKDQIRTRIVAMRQVLSKKEYSVDYYYDYTYGHHRSKSERVKALERSIPMAIVNLDKETGRMFTDNH